VYFSSEINIGNLRIGGANPVCVQSMTNTDTMDTYATVQQIQELVEAGCGLVRIATRNIKEAHNLKEIKSALLKSGIVIPLVADVHFNPKIAEIAAKHVEKVRINPGNYYSTSGDNYLLEEKLLPLLKICKDHDTIIRIGVNHGSLSERMLYDFGNTALGMVESLMEFVEVCKKHDFSNLVLSVKASNVKMMIEANLLLVERLKEKNLFFPIHLGVTESGNEEEGRIKSAAGIGYLLSHGIGDTVRVSLAEKPVNEVPVARMLVENYGTRLDNSLANTPEILLINARNNLSKRPLVITNSNSSFSDISLSDNNGNDYMEIVIARFDYENYSFDKQIIAASVDVTNFLYNNQIDGIHLQNNCNSEEKNAQITLKILQVLGLRISEAEYIACPTCARTSIDLVNCLTDLKKQTSHFIGLKFAVMGCAINGPGEMADSDYGILGVGNNVVSLYKGKEVVIKQVPIEKAVSELLDIIKENSG